MVRGWASRRVACLALPWAVWALCCASCSDDPTGAAAAAQTNDAASDVQDTASADASQSDATAADATAVDVIAQSDTTVFVADTAAADAAAADTACQADETCNGEDDDCDGQTDEGAPCDDGDACTAGDACLSGKCQPGQPASCEDKSGCNKGACDPAKGCVYTPIAGPCDDGSACTKDDSCISGLCIGDWLTCDDKDPCTNDTCDTVKGCEHVTVPDEVPCDDKKVCIKGKCVADGTLYAHTSSQLYKLDIASKTFALVGSFTFNKSSGSVTDIALNRTQNLYAVTFNDLFTCTTFNAACTWLMKLPTSFNGMTFVPMGTVYKDKEALIGIANNGGWHQIDFQAAVPTIKQLGSYGAGYTSSGDAFSVLGIGTFATVNKTGVSGDVLVEVEPTTGKVIKDLGAIGGSALYGFAWWDGVFYGFASSGQVWDVDVATGKGKQLSGFNIPKVSWWGAGVSTEAAF